MKYDVFISYRRDGGEYTARILRDKLTEMGYSVFFDVETLRSGAFNTRLYEAIDSCTDFLVVLSPNALDRCVNEGDWVRREIEYALSKKKNVVPVLLRGFVFPSELPKSLEQLPFCNGVNASSEFFDAFIEKLREFLLSKPALSRRLSPVAKGLAVLALAALVLLGGFLLVRQALAPKEQLYPESQTEFNLTEEVLANVGMNLTHLDNIARTKMEALDAAEDYLNSGTGLKELRDTFYVSYNLIQQENVKASAVPEQLLRRLDEAQAPFSSANLVALNTTVQQLREESLGHLAYILNLADPDNPLSLPDKQSVVAAYQKLLTQELQYHAVCINQFLLPVTNEKALKEFWSTTLTDLTRIPLESADWSTDPDILRDAETRCYNVMKEITTDLASIVGKTNVNVSWHRAELIQQYQAEGYTEQTARKMAEGDMIDETTLYQLDYWACIQSGMSEEESRKLAQQLVDIELGMNELRKYYAALVEDDADTLWYKMIKLLDCRLYDEAHEAADLHVEKWTDPDTDISRCRPAIHAFIEYVRSTKNTGGVMVIDYVDEAHPLLNPGDVIIALNGQSCRNYEEYTDLKTELTAESWTLTVLKAETLEKVELTITADMPLFYLASMGE